MEELDWRITPATKGSTDDQLTGIRQRIDEIDQHIATLLQERLSKAKEIGQIKANAGLSVTDNGREEAVLSNVRQAVGDDELLSGIGKIYATILEQSRELQKPLVESALTVQAKRQDRVYFPNVLIIGIGLIGGALARQIKTCMPATNLIAFDRPEVLKQAIAANIIDEAATDLAGAVKKAGLIILGAGPQENLEILSQIAPMTKRRQIVVDVTSTKSKICAAAEQLPLRADFIGGHPFFGSHKSGLDNSAALKIDNSRFVLTPTKRSSEIAIVRLSRWLGQLNIQVQQIDCEKHDQTVAATSHLIQLLAINLGAMLAENHPDQELKEKLALSGPSLQALSRLMSSPPSLWIDIFAQNQHQILAAIEELQQRLDKTRKAIANGDTATLKAEFHLAKRVTELL